MAERKIKHIRKNLFGEIVALCNPEENWSPRQKHDAIQDIENGVYEYHIQWEKIRIDIRVAEGPDGKYLCTDYDKPLIHKLEHRSMN